MNLLQTNSRIINHCKLTSFISCSAQSRNLFSLFSTLMQSYVPTFLSKPNTYIALQSNSSLYFWSRQNISIDLPYQFTQVKKTPYIGRFPLNNIGRILLNSLYTLCYASPATVILNGCYIKPQNRRVLNGQNINSRATAY